MKKLFVLIFLSVPFLKYANAQEAFTITHYNVDAKINKDASIDITETINVHFTESRHGIIRQIPYKYRLENLPPGIEKADLQLESGGYIHTIVDHINVNGWDYSVSKQGDYKVIKIGSKNKYVEGDQHYVISYRVLNAINFFKDHSEFYFNLIGDQWATTIADVNFKIELYDALPQTPTFFVATGSLGSKENNTITKWEENKIFYGHTTQSLNDNQGVTVGITFPKDFLMQTDYRFLGWFWIILPFLVFAGMFFTWKKWGKDDEVTIQTEFYPPENVSPSVSGYIIDGKLDRRDLTALVPYWGAGGYLKINEIEKKALLGLIKNKEYEFVKLKDLPGASLAFERTLFNGIFKTGDIVLLSDLKNVLYTTMNTAKLELEAEINKDDYYVKYSRGIGILFILLGVVFFVYGAITLISNWLEKLWLGIGILSSAIIIVVFGSLMSKKTKKGTALYQKLLGFKEFIKSVEKDRLGEFLKQDENYFDKVLPYAIVFDIADTWKDKLKGLEIQPPKWYSGNYSGGNFNTLLFMNSLDHSMNAMSSNFYATPHSSGSSGGSFSGGGGFSGGGFGGGGGSSW
ncbi:MAG: DUF2207 domain-containing protein [Bacteroidota bacterium]|nr:DUF2207 domain-containing protein [Bacteroidota bacterium]